MSYTAFSDAAVTVGTTQRSLIADTTAGIPTQTADGSLVGAIVRCSVAAAGDSFRIRVLGASSEILWEETRVGAWTSPVAIPAMILATGGWDITAIKLAGTDRSMGIEGYYESGASGLTADETAAAAARIPIMVGTAVSATATTLLSLALGSYPDELADDLLDGALLVIIGGTGSGQVRTIIDANYTAPVGPPPGDIVFTVATWAVTPDNTSQFVVLAHRTAGYGVWSYGLASADAGTVLQDAADSAASAVGRLPAALVGTRMDCSVGAMAANVLTATAINADAITAAKIADGAIDAATFAASAITSTVIADSAITGAKIANSAIGAGKIVDGAFTSAKFATGAFTSTTFATDSITAAALAADAVTELQAGLATAATQTSHTASLAALPTAGANAAAVWDASKSSHVTAGSFGEMQYLQIRRATAQSGSGTSITLDASASAVNDFYNGCVIVIASGTGAGQSNVIYDYTGATKIASVGRTWATNPDNTSVFVVTAFGMGRDQVAAHVWDADRSTYNAANSMGEGVRLAEAQPASINFDALTSGVYTGMAAQVWDRDLSMATENNSFGRLLQVRANSIQTATATTVTLDASASAVDDFYNGSLILITSGTGINQVRSITDYVGATKVATVTAWATTPAAVDGFAIIPDSASAGGGGDPWATVIEDGHTAGDILRGIISALVADATGFDAVLPRTISFKSLDGTKTRFTVTIAAAGRSTSTAVDLT